MTEEAMPEQLSIETYKESRKSVELEEEYTEELNSVDIRKTSISSQQDELSTNEDTKIPLASTDGPSNASTFRKCFGGL